jgi:hypothetical protein
MGAPELPAGTTALPPTTFLTGLYFHNPFQKLLNPLVKIDTQ